MMVCVIWSVVEITCALAWKSRCAVIMFTSCAVMSTLELSRAPDCIVPNPEAPPTPRTGWPDENVSAHSVLPSCCRPCGFSKLAIATCPRGVALPLVKRASTTPDPSMSMPMRRPVVNPFCVTALTAKASPNWVVLLKSTVRFMGAPPVAGVYAGKVILPPAGAVSAPVEE